MKYNTGETSEDLRKKYNPEGSNLRKAQMRILDMLKFIDTVCKENNIKWSLEGGNVLGAVRHNGFIPWDDDADIVMERSEYKKFCKYMKDHPHPQFVLQNHSTDPNYYPVYSVVRDLKSEYIQDTPLHLARKYRGMQVDVFPIERGAIPFLYKIARIPSIINQRYCAGKHKICAELLYWFTIGLSKFFRLISKVFGDKSKFMYTYGYLSKPVFNYNSVFPTKPLQFENNFFPGPNNLDDYLKSIYHNYMELPPINVREIHVVDEYRIED